jgi:hypothetical protein
MFSHMHDIALSLYIVISQVLAEEKDRAAAAVLGGTRGSGTAAQLQQQQRPNSAKLQHTRIRCCINSCLSCLISFTLFSRPGVAVGT